MEQQYRLLGNQEDFAGNSGHKKNKKPHLIHILKTLPVCH